MTKLTTAQRTLLRKMLDLNLALVQHDTRSDHRYLLVYADNLEMFEVVNTKTARNLADRRDCLRFDSTSSGNTQRVYRTLDDLKLR